MTARVKMGPKGQVVIPKAVRDDLGLHPGDVVEVRAERGEAIVRRPGGLGTALIGLLAGKSGVGGTGTEDLEAAHAEELAADEERTHPRGRP